MLKVLLRTLKRLLKFLQNPEPFCKLLFLDASSKILNCFSWNPITYKFWRFVIRNYFDYFTLSNNFCELLIHFCKLFNLFMYVVTILVIFLISLADFLANLVHFWLLSNFLIIFVTFRLICLYRLLSYSTNILITSS